MARTQEHIKCWDEVPLIVDMKYLCRFFGVSEFVLLKEFASGQLPAFRVGKMWRVNRQDLMDFCTPARNRRKEVRKRTKRGFTAPLKPI